MARTLLPGWPVPPALLALNCIDFKRRPIENQGVEKHVGPSTLAELTPGQGLGSSPRSPTPAFSLIACHSYDMPPSEPVS